MLKKVYTSNAPEAIGPYSQAIICGNMLFTSGQIPINPATGNVEAEGIKFSLKSQKSSLVYKI